MLNLGKEKQDEYVKVMMLRGVGTLETLLDDGDYCVAQSLKICLKNWQIFRRPWKKL